MRARVGMGMMQLAWIKVGGRPSPPARAARPPLASSLALHLSLSLSLPRCCATHLGIDFVNLLDSSGSLPLPFYSNPLVSLRDDIPSSGAYAAFLFVSGRFLALFCLGLRTISGWNFGTFLRGKGKNQSIRFIERFLKSSWSIHAYCNRGNNVWEIANVSFN